MQITILNHLFYTIFPDPDQTVYSYEQKVNKEHGMSKKNLMERAFALSGGE